MTSQFKKTRFCYCCDVIVTFLPAVVTSESCRLNSIEKIPFRAARDKKGRAGDEGGGG